MRHLWILVPVVLIAAGQTVAVQAQYGLYGAPDPIRPPTAPAVRTAQPAVQPQAAMTQPVAQPVLVYQAYPVAGAGQQAGYPVAGQAPAPRPTVIPSPAPSPTYVAPAYPATTRPVQVPMVAMYPAQPASPAPMYAVPVAPPQYVAAEPAAAPAKVAAPSAPIEEPPLAPVPQAAPATASPSPSDVLRPAPQPAPADNLINSMLAPSVVPYPATACDTGCQGGSYYTGGCSQFEQAACGRVPAASGCWYASAMMLVMGRDKPNGFWSSYEDGNAPNQLFKTDELENAWQWGGEITLGRKFCCGCNWFGIQGTYWTLSSNTSQAMVTHASGVSTPLTLFPCRIAGDDARDWFDGAAAHRLRRRDEYHNVEVSLVGFRSQACEYQSVWGLDWLMGFRFFRFEEELQFASLRAGGSWHTPTHWAAIDDRITNSLYGFQIGAQADLRMTQSIKLFCTPKFGIYNNHIENTFAFYRGDGVAADTNGTYPGGYPVQSSKDQISFLTEINLGVDWQFATNWSVRVGYRVLAATGIGLADNQVPPYIVDIPEIADIDTNGHLILHGAFVGLTYNF